MLCGNEDGLSLTGDLQIGVQRTRLPGVLNNAGQDSSLKTRASERDSVSPDGKLGNCIQALARGSGAAGETR